MKAKGVAGEEERRTFLRNPRAQLAEALTKAATSVERPPFVETQGYSDRVSGLGLWTNRRSMDDTPAERLAARRGDGPLTGARRTSGTDTPEIQELEETYRVSETRGDPHVVIRGQPVQSTRSQVYWRRSAHAPRRRFKSKERSLGEAKANSSEARRRAHCACHRQDELRRRRL